MLAAVLLVAAAARKADRVRAALERAARHLTHPPNGVEAALGCLAKESHQAGHVSNEADEFLLGAPWVCLRCTAARAGEIH